MALVHQGGAILAGANGAGLHVGLCRRRQADWSQGLRALQLSRNPVASGASGRSGSLGAREVMTILWKNKLTSRASPEAGQRKATKWRGNKTRASICGRKRKSSVTRLTRRNRRRWKTAPTGRAASGVAVWIGRGEIWAQWRNGTTGIRRSPMNHWLNSPLGPSA